MATYYKKIKGKNYDGKLISKAERSVKGRGDGRISLNDAKALLKAVRDSNDYTGIEKATMRHIRDNYDFTPEADRWFRTQIRSWAASRAPGKKPAPGKKSPSKKPSRARKAPGFEQEYIAPPSELIAREPVSDKKSRSRIPAVILLIAIIVILGLFLYPKTREWITGAIKPAAPTAETEAVKPAEKPAPSAAPVVVKPEMKAAPPAQEKPAPPKEEGNRYVVQVHEGLVNIAEKELKDYRKWVEIYRLNSATIPNTLMLFPGQKLKMPEGWKAAKQ